MKPFPLQPWGRIFPAPPLFPLLQHHPLCVWEGGDTNPKKNTGGVAEQEKINLSLQPRSKICTIQPEYFTSWTSRQAAFTLLLEGVRVYGSRWGYTFRPTPNFSSDPSQKLLFARPLEYFISILRPNTKYFHQQFLGLFFLHCDKFDQAKKNIRFDLIKRPKSGEGLGKQYFLSDKVHLGSGETYIRTMKNKVCAFVSKCCVRWVVAFWNRTQQTYNRNSSYFILIRTACISYDCLILNSLVRQRFAPGTRVVASAESKRGYSRFRGAWRKGGLSDSKMSCFWRL